MDKYLRGKYSNSLTNDNEPSTSSAVKNRRFLKEKTPPKPECIICGEMLPNEAMVPSKLLRHLNSNHRSYAKKDKSFFLRLLDQRRKQRQSLLSSVTVSDKMLETSYHVARLIARQKKPHTIGETLVKPACIEIVKSMLAHREVNEVKKVPLSADPVKKRINDMSSNILGILIAKLKTAQKFALQIDETTDIKNRAQLIAIVHFVDEGTITIKEHYLFCNQLPERITGEEIFRVTDDFFKTYDIPWSNFSSICTDSAAAMMDNKKGFISCVKRQNPNIEITHCCIHREAFMIKNLPMELLQTINQCITIINIIKSRALNSRIFKLMCAEMGSDYESLLFYTE
ncbi:PREDICTED: protein ZBED8-like, partial [Habropoda laboriosa]|uniref:protein ZBED8-like n=1 Tax=Habropoda laboriosa TaxID=597456 RepID=UPI00083DE38D